MANVDGETITLSDGRVYTWRAAGAVWETDAPPSAPPKFYTWELAGPSWQPATAPTTTEKADLSTAPATVDELGAFDAIGGARSS